jgi:TatD DNase family protein
MIDSHAHLYFDRFDADRDAVIERARAAGVAAIINVGIDPETSRAAIELARRHADLRAAAGIHPASRIDDLDAALDEVRRLAQQHAGAVVAIGEIGLDFHWDEVPRQEQYPRLEAQLALARELELPVIFHCRDALPELLRVLEAEPALPRGVFHCFAGGPDEARRALELGFHVSFAGNVTYPNAAALRESARAVPPEKLLLETDAPFLAPRPLRGKRNEPAFVVHTRDLLAGLHGLEPPAFGELAARTTRALFRLERGVV